MSRDASVTLPWADADYVFRLPIGQLRELQEKCDAGPMEVWRRLQDGTWRVDDISQPIRLGLIGGGLEPVKALKLVRDYVETQPLLQNVLTATAILGAAILGVPEEDTQKKIETEKSSRTRSRAAKSDSQELYGAGAAIGFSPQQVDAMSLWQMNAAIDGWVDAHTPADKGGMSATEEDEIWNWMMTKEGRTVQ